MRPLIERWLDGFNRIKWEHLYYMNCVPYLNGTFVVKGLPASANIKALETCISLVPEHHHKHTGNRSKLMVWGTNKMPRKRKDKMLNLGKVNKLFVPIRINTAITNYPKNVPGLCITESITSLMDGVNPFETAEFKAHWNALQQKVNEC